jgi:hypothetical protein
MRNGDQTIRDALKKAQAVLCQYLEPDGPNENQTVKRLFGILSLPPCKSRRKVLIGSPPAGQPPSRGWCTQTAPRA